MKKKSSLEKQKEQPSECDVCKRCKLNVNQQNEEFISKEELDKRNGIAEGKNGYFTLYLQSRKSFIKHIILKNCQICVYLLSQYISIISVRNRLERW